MTFASSSTGPSLSAALTTVRSVGCGRTSVGLNRLSTHRFQARYAATAAAIIDHDHPESSSSFPPPSSPVDISHAPIYRLQSTTTPSEATNYLSNLLHLPPAKAFPPSLALQILTHKSYRYVHAHRRPSRYPSTDLDPDPSCAPHNSRLSFIGRRAIATYLAMFVHSNIRSTVELRDLDLLRGRTLEEKMEAMRHVVNVGREVGGRWGIGEIVRWDHNEVTRQAGHHKINGMAIEAVLGGLFTHLGSPAAQRAFHLHLLPHLANQFREPRLIEQVEKMRVEIGNDFNGGIVKP